MTNFPVRRLLLVILLSLTSCIVVVVLLNWNKGGKASVFVWFDANANGVFDPGEQPLARVKVYATGGFGEDERFTDEEGKASVVQLAPPDCFLNCFNDFTVVVETPPGYKPTTPTTLPFTGENHTYQFGFVRDPSGVTATPYVPGLSCKTYPNIEPEKMAVAGDGSLWISLWNGAAKYDVQTDQFDLHKGPMGFYRQIRIGTNNEVWISDWDVTISRYYNSTWLNYANDNLTANSDMSIGSTVDARVWFAFQAFSSELASFNPDTNQWRSYVEHQDHDFGVGKKVKASTDGSIWFAAFDDGASKTPPDSTSEIQWKVYDLHTLTQDEIEDIPDMNQIISSKMASDGTIWLSTTEGLTHFDPIADKWSIINWPHSYYVLPTVSMDTSELAIGPDQSIWMGTTSYDRPLVLHFTPNASGGIWRTFDDRDGIPNAGEIKTIAVTPDGTVWLGSDVVTGCTVLK